MSESEFRFRLESLEKDASEQTKEFKEFRKIMYERFSNVEGHMHRIPTVEESNLMKEAAEYFKAKKELTTRVQEALITKGTWPMPGRTTRGASTVRARST
jgi:hypothetical protein